MTVKPTQKPLRGQTFAFFGEFSFWPSYHGASPQSVAKRLGARLVTTVDAKLDCLVLGNRRGTGRFEAKKQAEKVLQGAKAKKAKKVKLKILDEAAYREMVRVDLKGKRFAFVGGFDCSPAGLEDGMLAQMVKAV